jgi:hypothetical protein
MAAEIEQGRPVRVEDGRASENARKGAYWGTCTSTSPHPGSWGLTLRFISTVTVPGAGGSLQICWVNAPRRYCTPRRLYAL